VTDDLAMGSQVFKVSQQKLMMVRLKASRHANWLHDERP
jgi:hypothetical protein